MSNANWKTKLITSNLKLQRFEKPGTFLIYDYKCAGKRYTLSKKVECVANWEAFIESFYHELREKYKHIALPLGHIDYRTLNVSRGDEEIHKTIWVNGTAKHPYIFIDDGRMKHVDVILSSNDIKDLLSCPHRPIIVNIGTEPLSNGQLSIEDAKQFLPKNVLIVPKDKYITLHYSKRTNGVIESCSIILKCTIDLNEQLLILHNKVVSKYPESSSFLKYI